MDDQNVRVLKTFDPECLSLLEATLHFRYDPEANISDRVEFESERIEFLTSVEALMISKARIKLNTKKLYAADGRAVQEMLKIATLLYQLVISSIDQ